MIAALRSAALVVALLATGFAFGYSFGFWDAQIEHVSNQGLRAREVQVVASPEGLIFAFGDAEVVRRWAREREVAATLGPLIEVAERNVVARMGIGGL